MVRSTDTLETQLLNLTMFEKLNPEGHAEVVAAALWDHARAKG